MVLIVFIVLEIRKRRRDKVAQDEISMYYDKGVPLSQVGKITRRASKANSIKSDAPPAASAVDAVPDPLAEAVAVPLPVVTQHAQVAPAAVDSVTIVRAAAPVIVAVPATPFPNESISEEEDSASRRPFSASIPPPPASRTAVVVQTDTSEDVDVAVTMHGLAGSSSPTPSSGASSYRSSANVSGDIGSARVDELAKETDGELVSTEEVESTPRGGTPSNLTPRGGGTPAGGSPRGVSGSIAAARRNSGNIGSAAAKELDELEAISAQAKKELKEMEEAMKKFE